MRYLFLVAVVLSFVSLAAAVTIDTFDDNQLLVANSGTPTANSTVNGAGVLGGDRWAQSSWTSGDQNVQMEVNSGGNSLMTAGLGAGTMGTVQIEWAGAGGLGLGGIDLTESGTLFGIGVRVLFDDLPLALEFSITDTSAVTNTAVINLAGGIFTPQTAYLSLGSFGATDVTSVDKIVLNIVPSYPATDLQIDFIETMIPEPSTIGLLCLGSLIFARKRKA